MVTRLNSDLTLKEFLLGCIKLAKINADPNKYVCRDYSSGFDSCSEFSFPNDSVVKNIIICGVDMSSSVHIDNKKKSILVLGKGWDETTLIREAQYSITFSSSNRNFV